MKARISVVTALAALTAVPAVALGSATHAASNSKTYHDSAGEDPQAPDIRTIVISNDDSRNIVVKINISNRRKITPDMAIIGYFNADGKTRTGDRSTFGADYAIEVDPGSVSLYKWNGSDYIFASEQTSLTYSYAATGATVRINAADLGDTKAFKFAWIAVSGIGTDASGNADFTNAHRDFFPNAGDGFASYTVVAALKLKETAFLVTPSPAKTGQRVSASLAATQSDSNGFVEAGAVSCVGSIGGKRVAATHSLSAGVATCNWDIPKSAKGKTLRGTVKLVVQRVTLTKSFAVKIR